MRNLRVAEPGQAPTESHKADFGLPLASEERARLLKPGVYDVYVSVGTPTAARRRSPCPCRTTTATTATALAN